MVIMSFINGNEHSSFIHSHFCECHACTTFAMSLCISQYFYKANYIAGNLNSFQEVLTVLLLRPDNTHK